MAMGSTVSLGTTAAVLNELLAIPWAAPLLDRIKREATTPLKARNIEPLLFEARYAIALHAAGLEPRYEHRAGVGESTVDFMIPSTAERRGWLIELVSIRQSAELGRATKRWRASAGLSGESLLLRGGNGTTKPWRHPRRTTAAELIRVIEKIEEKVYDQKHRHPTPISPSLTPASPRLSRRKAACLSTPSSAPYGPTRNSAA